MKRCDYTPAQFEAWLTETFGNQETFREDDERFAIPDPWFGGDMVNGPDAIAYRVLERIMMLGIHPKELVGRVPKLEYYDYHGLCLWKGVKIKDLIQAVQSLLEG